MISLVLWLACDGRGARGPFGDDTAWYMTFGGAVTDEAWGLDRDDGSGDLFVATHQGDPVSPDGFIYRITDRGDVSWETEWDGGFADELFVVEEVGGELYVGGAAFTTATDLFETRAVLLHLDAGTGDLLGEPWDYDDDGWNEIDGVVVDDDPVYVSGWDDGDVLLAEIAPDGEPRQLQVWDGGGWDEANGHMVADDEFLYVAGRVGGTSEVLGGDSLLAAFRKDDLSEVWTRSFGEPGSLEDGLGLATDGTSLFVTGIGPGGVFVLAYDLDGNLLWDTNLDANASRALQATPAGLYVAGTSGDDIALFLVDPQDGTLLGSGSWGGAQADVPHDLFVADGRGFVVGETGSVGAGGLDGLLLSFETDPWRFPDLDE